MSGFDSREGYQVYPTHVDPCLYPKGRGSAYQFAICTTDPENAWVKHLCYIELLVNAHDKLNEMLLGKLEVLDADNHLTEEFGGVM